MISEDFNILKTIEPIPKGFFRRNRERLLKLIRQSPQLNSKGLIFLSGPEILTQYDDDGHVKILHEPFFYYLFGIREDKDTYGVIEIESGKCIVFTRLFDISESFWYKPKTLEDFTNLYEIDEARSLDDLKNYFDSMYAQNSRTIYLNTGYNPVNKKPTFTPESNDKIKTILESYIVDRLYLYPMGRECRLFKSEEEVNILKNAIKVSNYAHLKVMKTITIGMTERQLSDYFTSINLMSDSDIPYPNIFCAGCNGSYLHYQPSKNTPFKDGQLVLNDSGAKIHCYNSDITRTFPVNGKFTDRQKSIYNLVLLAQNKALELMKPGIKWIETQNAALKIIVEGLYALGLLQINLKIAIDGNFGRYFMPHSLGHYIGLYVHDMPGLEEMSFSKDSQREHFNAINRNFEPGMVLTVEPGIYFNQTKLNEAYSNEIISKYFNKKIIEEYQNEIGGIRIEDMFLITDKGYENLSFDLIKSVEDIEAYMTK